MHDTDTEGGMVPEETVPPTTDQETAHNWRGNSGSSSGLSVPSERIQFQITLEEGESGNEDD